MTTHAQTGHAADPLATEGSDPRLSGGSEPRSDPAAGPDAPGPAPADAGRATHEGEPGVLEEALRRGQEEPGRITIIVPSRRA
jgi:hypothetical protein